MIFCFKIKPNLLILSVSYLHIHKHQDAYIQVLSPGFLDMEFLSYLVLVVSPGFFSAWWRCACFGCAFLYLLGAISNLSLHPVPPLWIIRNVLTVLCFLIWVSYGSPHGCDNLGAVNTYHSQSHVIWRFLLVLPRSSFHSLSIHANCKVYYSSL